MKKRILLVGLMILVLLVSACGAPKAEAPKAEAPKAEAPKAEAPKTEAPKAEEKKVYTIGINQLVEHPALDDCRKGFEDRLKELGIEVKINYSNAQGDMSNSMAIANKLVQDKSDLIYAISTPSAQSCKKATEANKIPVLFNAVSDPVASGLVASWDKGGDNITGISDKAPLDDQLKLFAELNPKIKTIGTIYSTKESNSEIQLKELEEAAPKYGLKVEKMGISEISELPAALDVIVPKVDAMYLLADNMIASSVSLVAKRLVDAKMISVVAEESQVKGGILITKGSSYYEMGKQAADMAKAILVDKKSTADIKPTIATNLSVTYNEETAKALNLDLSKYKK